MASAGRITKATFDNHGVGNTRTATFTEPKPWTLTFNYDCSSLGHKGSFDLVLHSARGSKVTVTSQQGLGGGGSHAYHPGTYSLTITTPCNWSISGAPTPH